MPRIYLNIVELCCGKGESKENLLVLEKNNINPRVLRLISFHCLLSSHHLLADLLHYDGGLRSELFYRRLYSISLFSFTLMGASIDGALNNSGLPLFFKSFQGLPSNGLISVS